MDRPGHSLWGWAVRVVMTLAVLTGIWVLALVIRDVGGWRIGLVCGIWMGILSMNLLEFHRWRTNTHRIARRYNEENHRFQLDVFLANVYALDELTNLYEASGYAETPEGHQWLLALWGRVAAFPLPTFVPKRIHEVRVRAAQKVQELSGQSSPLH